MIILTGGADETQIFILKDGSEIVITAIELEGAKSKVLICTSKEVEVIHEFMDKAET
jgi:hypothetical protein